MPLIDPELVEAVRDEINMRRRLIDEPPITGWDALADERLIEDGQAQLVVYFVPHAKAYLAEHGWRLAIYDLYESTGEETLIVARVVLENGRWGFSETVDPADYPEHFGTPSGR